MCENRQARIFKYANKVYEFMMSHESPGGWDYAFENESELAYGEALMSWNERGRPSKDYFSTEDPDMIALKDEFTKEFGLEVVSREEGNRRAGEIHKVCGWVN